MCSFITYGLVNFNVHFIILYQNVMNINNNMINIGLPLLIHYQWLNLASLSQPLQHLLKTINFYLTSRLASNSNTHQNSLSKRWCIRFSGMSRGPICQGTFNDCFKSRQSSLQIFFSSNQ